MAEIKALEGMGSSLVRHPGDKLEIKMTIRNQRMVATYFDSKNDRKYSRIQEKTGRITDSVSYWPET